MFKEWIKNNYTIGGYDVQIDNVYNYNGIEICTLKSKDLFYDLPILKKVDNKVIPIKVHSQEGLQLLNFINKN